ncbi:glycosyltransferase family 2 protein [Simiduia agarivorans]|uniref:Rhamnosyltransferase n=1 Tax=Simiduia agarivorans (strain DSM 21679 / JCM 13881 / BCRC 17597 / SA1) TaxID=1117647 RepID=K4KHT4_SIMAS|nr:glycosyltransferase family 2 protein [Simiduia agarivorans]AFU97740.1 rhamnosyltransferase [Simiduia agarivorans SA1 = DSM 21679]
MVYAVVVLYNPELTLALRLLRTLLDQVSKVVVIDNSPESHAHDFELDCVEYIFPGKNTGIASAHNVGLKMALKEGAQYCALFDQDSQIESDMIALLADDMRQLTEQGRKIAAVGPVVISARNGRRDQALIAKPRNANEGFVSQLIASGMLINTAALDDVGIMDESLFIDAVDHEWCWRARAKSYALFQSPGVVMLHHQGEADKQLLGFRYRVSAPFRLYYQFRNVLLLCRRSYVPLYWKLRNLALMLPKLLVNAARRGDGVQRFRWGLKGIWHGLLNQSGCGHAFSK